MPRSSPSSDRPPVRALLATAAVTAAGAVLAACGSSSSSNGVASKGADQIVQSSQSSIKTVKSVHVAGSLVSGGQTITLDLNLLSGKGGQGTMSAGGLSFQLVTVGNTVYVKGSDAFWRHFGGAAAVQLFKGKWLKGPATGNLASFASLTNLTQLITKILSSHGSLTKGQESTVRGQKVIAVKDTSGQGGTLYVATTGQPYPIQISKTGSDGGHLSFDHYNASISITAPTGAIDISQFEH
jgi:hypothetical protein